MKKRSLVVICLGIMVLFAMTSVVLAEGKVLLDDDFSASPYDTWTQMSSVDGEQWIWNEEDQTFVLDVITHGDKLQIAGDEDWTDYSVELRVKSSMGHRFGVLFRGQLVDGEVEGIAIWCDSMNLYVAHYPSWAEYGSFSKPFTTDEEGVRALAFQADTWYVLRVDVKGQTATVFLNDKELGTAEFEGYERGFVGLYSYVEGVDTFDYVKVTEL